MEFNNDALTVFYILEIVNSARTRVDTGAPMVIELPEDAADAARWRGRRRRRWWIGGRITITGPFASGVTPVQVAFRLPHSDTDGDVHAVLADRRCSG